MVACQITTHHTVEFTPLVALRLTRFWIVRLTGAKFPKVLSGSWGDVRVEFLDDSLLGFQQPRINIWRMLTNLIRPSPSPVHYCHSQRQRGFHRGRAKPREVFHELGAIAGTRLRHGADLRQSRNHGRRGRGSGGLTSYGDVEEHDRIFRVGSSRRHRRRMWENWSPVQRPS
jgi:hypothetical protein